MIRHLLTSVLLLFFTSINAQVQLGQDIFGMEKKYASQVDMPSSNTVAVSGYYEEFYSISNGYVKVSDYQNGQWVQRGSTITNGTGMWDNFGESISMPNDNLIAIGSPHNSENGLGAGKVQFYEWDGNNWNETYNSFLGQGPATRLGMKVIMPSPTTVAVSAPYLNNVRGAVFIYDWNGTSWNLRGDTLLGVNSIDYFGKEIAMPNENTIAVGASSDDNGVDAGQVKIYDWDGTAWVLRGMPINGENPYDMAGTRISMPSINTVAIPSILYDTQNEDAGKIRVFDWNGINWVARPDSILGEHENERIGAVYMPTENFLAISASNYSDTLYARGRARLFKWNGNNWIQKGDDIVGEDSNLGLGNNIIMPDTNRIGIAVSRGRNELDSIHGYFQVYDYCASVLTDEISSCAPITWMDGNTYDTTNNWATHMLTNSAGCDSIIYLDLTIYPDINITNNNDHLIANAQDASYQWIDCDDNNAPINGETNQAFYFTENGNYAVIVTQNGCTDTSECITVSDVSVPTLSKEHIKIYPNPTDGKLYIQSKELTSVKVMDAMGRVIATHATSAQSHSIDLSAHKQGVYIIQVNDTKQIRTYRVVLK